VLPKNKKNKNKAHFLFNLVDDCCCCCTVATPILKQAGGTALHYAARDGKHGVASLLLKQGADSEAQTVVGYTPLHYAAMAGSYYALAVLLQHGANKHAKVVTP
jgi:hypothetical protein